MIGKQFSKFKKAHRIEKIGEQSENLIKKEQTEVMSEFAETAIRRF